MRPPADRETAWSKTIQQKKVTYDFERLMQGATKVKTSEFASHIIENMHRAVLHGRRLAAQSTAFLVCELRSMQYRSVG